MDIVWHAHKSPSSKERIATVLGVIFPPIASHESSIIAELHEFQMRHDDTDAKRLCDFLIGCVQKYAPDAGDIESK